MRFKFCGGGDAPEWLLAEVGTISTLSSVRVKLLAGNILKGLCDGAFDYAKVTKLAQQHGDEADVRAAVAALHFMLLNAGRYGLEEAALCKELEQLGLPKEHADAISKTFAKDKGRLSDTLQNSVLSLGTAELRDWDVNLTLATSSGDPESASVRLHFGPGLLGRPEGLSVEADEVKFRILLHELKAAREAMDAAAT